MREQHKRFADFYIKDLNITHAYKQAYPNCKKDTTAATNGGKLLKNAEVQDYIKERMASKEKSRIADQDEILDFLTKVMRGEVLDQMGFETSVRDRKDAAIQLGKRHAMWIDNQKLSGEVGVKIINDIPRNNKPN